jgi:DNA polymerase I-like protein with 3'-5' exonuclease and polymerase domains
MQTVFIQPDLSQAEARVVAYLCGSQLMIDLFNDSSKSIHMENAKAILGFYPKKDGPDYLLGKKTSHASNYRISAGFFSTVAGIPRAQASSLLEAYHAAYPEIREWHEWVRETIAAAGILRTPFGRERIFATARAELLITGKVGNESWKDAISYVPQATVPDVTNKGMVALWESPIGKDLQFHHQGHDSFLCSCPVELLGEAATELVRCLTIPFEITDIKGNRRTLTIPCDVAWGFSWGAMKAWKGEPMALRHEWERWVEEKNVRADVKESLLT